MLALLERALGLPPCILFNFATCKCHVSVIFTRKYRKRKYGPYLHVFTRKYSAPEP